MLGLDSQRKTLSNLYDIDQIRNSVDARSLPASNVLYGSSTVSNEQGLLHRRLDVVKNKQGFPHFRERVWVKKLVHENRIRFGTWNWRKIELKQNKAVDKIFNILSLDYFELHMNQWFDCYLEVWTLKAGNWNHDHNKASSKQQSL